MGDWSLRQHWFRANAPGTALALYQRLEAFGGQLEREERRTGGATGLRFGFVSPTLVAATTTQKWGHDGAFGGQIIGRLAGVLHLEDVRDEDRWSRGVAELEPELGFAWCPAGELRDLLAATLPPLQFGTATVYQLPDAATRALIAGAAASPWQTSPTCEGTVVVGVTSPHGLLALGTWWREVVDSDPVVTIDHQATRLLASRLAGPSAWAVVSSFDHSPFVPATGLHGDVDRHGPRALWRSPGVRRSWGPVVAQRLEATAADLAPVAEEDADETDADETDPDEIEAGDAAPAGRKPIDLAELRLILAEQPGSPRARHAVIALGVLGTDADRARLPPGDAWLGAHARWALARLPGAATAWLPALCARARRGAPAPGFAQRAAEIAHAWARSTYWMVRCGAPQADVPALERARRRGERVPLEVVALIAAWDGKADGLAAPITMWCDAVLRSLASGDDHAVLRAVIALDNAAAAVAANPAWEAPPLPWIDHVLACAWDGDEGPPAEPASRLLARAPRFAALGERYKTGGATADFEADALALLAELPPPLALDPDGDALAMTAWLANAVAWARFEASDLQAAAPLADRALACSAHDDQNVIDTWVWIQLGLGNADGAYAAVARLVRAKPDSTTVMAADLATSPAYLAWRARSD